MSRAETAVSAATEWALERAESGWAVFPCRSNKRPATANGHLNASKDPDEIKRMFHGLSDDILVGIRTGSESEIFVLDLDLYKGPEAQIYLDQLLEADLLPKTRVHKTRSGGLHYFYSSKHGYPNVVPHDCVEVKGEGGYVIDWEYAGGEVVSTGIVDAPKGLIDKITAHKESQANDNVSGLKAKILRGENFHDSLARLAARLLASGVSQGEAVRQMFDVLRGSVASEVHHPRYERWRALMADDGQEVSRIVLTASRKYSSTAASEDMGDAIHEKMVKVAAKMFQPTIPVNGEADAKIALDPSVNPFEGMGYYAHDERDIFEQRYIMHPMLVENETVLVSAEPKTGKTAVLLTAGMHIACGLNFGEGLKISEQRSVLYMALESRRAIELRLRASKKHLIEQGHKVPDFIPFFTLERSLNLMKEEARIQMAENILQYEVYLQHHEMPSLGMIVIDTFTKAMAGGDQNSASDTSLPFELVGRARDMGVTASFVFIHHLGKSGGVRGSTNIEADPDVLSRIEKDGNQIKWTIDRARSVEEGGSYGFALSNYDLGMSSQGFMINAPICDAVDFKPSGSASTGLTDARSINAILTILTLTIGKIKLEDALTNLRMSGLAPEDASKRAKLKAVDPVIQTFFADLIGNGYAFAGKFVTLTRNTAGLIVGIDVRAA